MRTAVLTDIKERYELLLDFLEFCGILFIGIFQMLKGATWVNIVTWVDTHLLTVLCCHICRMGSEMDICHQRCRVAICLQSGRDILHVLGLANALGGETNEFTSSINDAFGLSHRALRIVGVGGSHRLDADGVVATNGNVAHMGYATNSSCSHI